MAVPARAVFDLTIPSSGDGFTSANFRNNYQSLYQMDLLPLRPRAHGSQASLADTGIMVLGTDASGYHQPVKMGNTLIILTSGDITGFTAFPSANPRIDIVYISGDGVIRVTKGGEAASPSSPIISGDVIPICHIYQKTTATKIVNFEDKDTSSSDSYIIRDVRPFLTLSGGGGSTGAGTYTIAFVSGDTAASVLTVTHALSKKFVAIQVFDSGDKVVIPTNITATSASVSTVDLTGFPIAGTWNVRVVA